jgi:Signal transduction histidine kinase
MLIAIVIILLLDSLILTVVKKNADSLLIFGLCGSLIIMLSGIIIYIAKIGGLSDTQYVFLFLSMKIQQKIQFMIITLDKLGYVIAVGRCLFPLFLFVISVKYSTIRFVVRYRKWAGLFAIPPVLSLIFYYPSIFYVVVCNRFTLQETLMTATLVWILIYLILAVTLLIGERFTIPFSYLRRQYSMILSLYVSLALIYGIYCVQDPIQVYQLYGFEYLWVSGFSYANPTMPVFGWAILTFVTITSSLMGFWNLIGYTRINYKVNKEDIVLQRKFDISSAGASVFVHSIKNQLLSANVLYRKINKLFESDQPDVEAIKEYVGKLQHLNENMLAHMDQLYASTKSHSVSLKSVSVENVIDKALQSYHEKYPENQIQINIKESVTILADLSNLSQALYNLLINAQDAILKKRDGSEGKVELSVYNWRSYTVFEISDNGVGISKSDQKKILDPFFTTKNTNYSWGMGLHYVQRIAKSHYGSLKFESTENQGSKFYLLLPRFGSSHKS